MKHIRAALIALGFLAGIAPSFAQAPPPVPGLPDAERRTSYSISANTCQCNVNFALYGDSTDYQNWLEVFINGVRVNYNDSTFGWTITSPTGPLASIARPVTDAVLTFNQAQTGTIQIVGARRPRRVSQFTENRGVAARDLNQVLTDIIAQNREIWDKTNDMTGRGLFSQPGNTVGPLPLPSLCSGKFLSFDATGLNPICNTGGPGSGNVVGPGTSGTGHFAIFTDTSGAVLGDGGLPAASATTDTTNASNISTGILGSARGGAGTVTGALKANGTGTVSQAACADLSNASASCATDATNATNIASGTLADGRLSSNVPLKNGNNTFSGVTTWTGALRIPGRVVTAAGAVTVSATTDYFICINKTVGAATAVNLPASPATWSTYLIKDCKGDASSNNITLTPAAGTIDGAATYVMNISRQSASVTYNGTEWSVN